MRRVALVVLVALAGCSLDLDRLRRGSDASVADGSIDSGPDPVDASIDAPPGDGGCACPSRTRWRAELPALVGAGTRVLAVHAQDLDRDGAVDVVATVAGGATQLLYGVVPGCTDRGALDPGVPLDALPAGGIPAIDDRNDDGIADVAVPDAVSSLVRLTGETGFSRWTLLSETAIALDFPATIALAAELDLDGDRDTLVFGGDTLVQAVSTPDGTRSDLGRLAAVPITGAVTSDSGGAGVLTFAFVTVAGTVEMARSLGAGLVLDGALPLAEGAMPTDVAFADLDDDGEDELVVADARSQVLWVLAPSNGTYSDSSTIPLAHPPSTVASGDVDGDGLVELVVGSTESSTILIVEAASGTTTETIPDVAGPLDIAVADLGGDGLVDLVVGGVDGAGARLTVLRAVCDP